MVSLTLPFVIGFSLLFYFSTAEAEDIVTTKVFITPLGPSLFNWTPDYNPEGFWYRASLVNLPDLPHWMTYYYSKRHRKGFIYGVPPAVPSSPVEVEVVALNRENYETRKAVIALNITEKNDPAKYEVRLKIDSQNIEDMFDPHRLFSLLRIFTTVLWPSSANDLYMTFLESAVKVGARLPLRPNDEEGVIVHLGSSTPFSDVLINLQDEVKPLWKLSSCPRDFKRSTVDRYFRPNDFVIDWCAFRLINVVDSYSDKAQYQEPSVDRNLNYLDMMRKQEIPQRCFEKELISVLVVPTVSLMALIAVLSAILCFQSDSSVKKSVDGSDTAVRQFEAVQRATKLLMRDGTKADGSPNLNDDRTDSCRPSPPPYICAKRRYISDS